MELVQKKKRIRPLCKLLGIQEPIIQAPMAGNIIPAEFAAYVSNSGLLGSLASGYLNYESCKKLIQETQKYTQNPFQLNLFVEQTSRQANLSIEHKPDALVALEKSIGMNESALCEAMPESNFDAILSLALERRVPIISTTFGVLSEQQLAMVKETQTILMVTINSLADAHMAMLLNQPDVLIYQNKLAGGHQGGFNTQECESYDVCDTAILALKKEYPDILIVKSGAIVTRDDIKLALKQGFDGVQIGTGFLATKESTASPEHKTSIVQTTKVCDTCFSKSVTGKQARGIKNQLMQLPLQETPHYPQQHYATKAIRAFAKVHGLKEYQSLWAGTGSVKIEKIPSLEEYIYSILKYPQNLSNLTQRMHYVRGESALELHG